MCCQPTTISSTISDIQKNHFFFSKQWLTSNYLLQSPIWKHEGNKKKHLKYITNTFKEIPVFFPPCKEKKTFALRAEGRWTDPKSQKFSQPESKHEDPPQKKLRKKSFNWLLPIIAIGPPPASIMYVFQLDRKNWDSHHRIETPTTPLQLPLSVSNWELDASTDVRFLWRVANGLLLTYHGCKRFPLSSPCMHVRAVVAKVPSFKLHHFEGACWLPPRKCLWLGSAVQIFMIQHTSVQQHTQFEEVVSWV